MTDTLVVTAVLPQPRPHQPPRADRRRLRRLARRRWTGIDRLSTALGSDALEDFNP